MFFKGGHAGVAGEEDNIGEDGEDARKL